MYFLKSYWNFYENNSRVLESSKIGPHLVLIFLRRSLFYHYNAVDLKSSKQDFVYARTGSVHSPKDIPGNSKSFRIEYIVIVTNAKFQIDRVKIPCRCTPCGDDSSEVHPVW